MRSSLSVILSSPTPDPNMSRPDYQQTIYDHAALLVLVKHLGDELHTKQFNYLFERISRVTGIKVSDGAGNDRSIFARYVKDYPVGNNDWGDFQTHRRLVGLITLSKCKNEVELNEVCRVHESLKVKYQATIYDSRCFIFGVNTKDTIQLTPPSNFKSRALYYTSEGDPNSELENQLTEFLSSLFWILESKRQERSREKIEKATLLFAPFEKRDFVGLDMESRTNKKRCTGRLTKHMGDLCLQSGLLHQSLTYYHSSMEILRSINDWLWIASSAEGLCAASAMILYPKSSVISSLQRNASLQERSIRQKIPSPASSNSLSRISKTMSLPSNILSAEEIYKSYREAIIHYSKYQNAGVIETEACFKAARIAVKHNPALQAHSLLQNVIFINLTLTEEEKIQRLMNLSELYASIGFHRKASFYRRLTATRYVSARNPNTDWEQCYQLMLQALPGHNLSLDPNEYPPNRLNGWPRLQRQVLQDLVVAAKRLGNPGLATRHMTFLLQTMWHHMNTNERHEAALQLQSLTTQCEGSPVPLVLDTGLIIPPANLLNIPQPLNFVVQNLKVNLRPHKLEVVKQDYGPFLFTPLNIGTVDRKSSKKSNKLDYLWVADELSEVILEVCNPLPMELEVTNMLLLTSGIVFESIPLTITLPASSSNQSIILTGTPKEVGELEITGYSTHTLGVKSNCRLRHIKNIPQSVFTLQVVPALPILQMSTDAASKNNKMNESQSPIISLYAGESYQCNVIFENTGIVPIEVLEVTIESSIEQNMFKKILKWDVETVKNSLPLEPGKSVNLPLNLFGASSFLSQYTNVVQDLSTTYKSSIMSGSSSFQSLSSPRQHLHDKQHTPLSVSTFSIRSNASSLNSFSSLSKVPETSSRTMECQVKVRYSGGAGLTAGYCRLASLTIYIEIINSILITNWDVLPAETSTQFYLVLDVVNVTNHEIELNYTKSKNILIEENESCRIPIPIARCPITTSDELWKSDNCMDDNVKINITCSEHIASQVNLQWKLATLNREGHAPLDGFTFSSTMLDLVRMSPFNWEVLINSEALKGNSSTHAIGDVLQLGIWVHNSLSWPIQNFTLQFHFFQDYQNGMTKQQLETCLVSTGTMETTILEIEKYGKFYHECNIIFFHAGVYKLNVQCSSYEKRTWKLIPPIDIEVVDST